jgi:uncharacterized DUF497 family protein
LGWSPAPHWSTILCVALSTSSPTGASDQLKFVWGSGKGKSTGSDHLHAYNRYYNLVCDLMWSNLGLGLEPHWATILCVALSTSSPTGASDQLKFVWDSSKGKSTGSDHLHAYNQCYNLVCVLRRSNLGLGLAPHWSTILCVALSTSSPTGASDQLKFVWDSSKGKSSGSDHFLSYNRYYNLVCDLMWSNLGLGLEPHWATISCVALSTSSPTGASDQLKFVWDSNKGKSTGSDHHLA